MDEFEKIVLKDYRYLLKIDGYDIQTLKNRLRFWGEKMEAVVKDSGLDDYADINISAFYYFICDYFADIARLKDFHPVTNANYKKILAYGAFWFIRKHPVFITKQDISHSELYINEKIALSAIISGVMEVGGVNDISESFLHHLMYFFKYRIYTAQSIEIIIDALMRGKDLYPQQLPHRQEDIEQSTPIMSNKD